MSSDTKPSEILNVSRRPEGTNYTVKVYTTKYRQGYDLVDVLVHGNGAMSIKSAHRSTSTPLKASALVRRYLAADTIEREHMRSSRDVRRRVGSSSQSSRSSRYRIGETVSVSGLSNDPHREYFGEVVGSKRGWPIIRLRVGSGEAKAYDPKQVTKLSELRREFKRDATKSRDHLKYHKGYTVKSGRRLLGTIRPTTTRGVFAWSSNVSKDRGVTNGLDNAARLVIRESGMSPRQYEFDLVDVDTGKRRSLSS